MKLMIDHGLRVLQACRSARHSRSLHHTQHEHQAQPHEHQEQDELMSEDDVRIVFVCPFVRSLTRHAKRTSSPAHHHLRLRKLRRDDSRNRSARTMRGSSSRRGMKWTRPKYGITQALLASCIHLCKVADAVKRYSYLLGQTDLFRHFVDVKVRSGALIHVQILTLYAESTRPRIRSHT